MAKDFGQTWPLTVRSGTLSCDSARLMTFRAGDKTYAVNDRAARWAGLERWHGIEEIWGNWTPYAAYPGRKDVQTIIAYGVRLCESGRRSIAISGTPPKIVPWAELRRWSEQQRGYVEGLDQGASDVYIGAYLQCSFELESGARPDPEAAGAAAEKEVRGTGVDAAKGCADAFEIPPRIYGWSHR